MSTEPAAVAARLFSGGWLRHGAAQFPETADGMDPSADLGGA